MGLYTYTREEWIEDRLETPLYSEMILTRGIDTRYGDEMYFEFDCMATFEFMQSYIIDTYHVNSLEIIDISNIPDEFEIADTIQASDIPCENGRYIRKSAWIYDNEDTDTIIATDDSGQMYFEFENDIAWDFFRIEPERRYGISVHPIAYDNLPELFVLVDTWCEYDI